MTSAATVNFSDTDQGLFSPAEIRSLMHVEFDRAVRYGYPAAAMLVEVDRLEYLHSLYGWESKEEILSSVIRLLRSTTRDSDFLGCMQGSRILALFPHANEETIQAIAGRMLHVCRELDFRIDERSLRATLSIGVSVLKPGADLDFAAFLSSAEEAVGFAAVSGGDRFVRREPAREVIQELREEIEDEARQLAAEALAVAPVVTQQDHELEAALEAELRATLERGSETGLDESVIEEALRVALDGVRRARDVAVTRTVREHLEKIDLLERRVTKLKDLLDATEQELGRVAASRGADSGVASIYRSVQGLRGDERNFESKKEMLTLIFEANLELQKKRKREP